MSKSMSADDRMVWKKVAETVKPLPLHYDNATFCQLLDPPVGPRPTARLIFPMVTPAAAPKAGRNLPDLAVGEMPGLDRRTAQRVVKGNFAIEGRIDLHGMTCDQAQMRLMHYVEQAYKYGKRAILVITGKGSDGRGVLKAEVPRWLNLPPLRQKILGFSHALPKDGGEGALYVLLKRHRQ